jgi:flagellar biosynthesis protein FlhA
MRYRAPDGAIHAVALSPELDTRLGASVMVQPGYVGLELSGSDSRLLIEQIDKAVRSLSLQRYQPILLCTTRIRLALRNLTERHMPQLTVLSYEEILPSVSVQVHAQVEV